MQAVLSGPLCIPLTHWGGDKPSLVSASPTYSLWKGKRPHEHRHIH